MSLGGRGTKLQKRKIRANVYGQQDENSIRNAASEDLCIMRIPAALTGGCTLAG